MKKVASLVLLITFADAEDGDAKVGRQRRRRHEFDVRPRREVASEASQKEKRRRRRCRVGDADDAEAVFVPALQEVVLEAEAARSTRRVSRRRQPALPAVWKGFR